VGIFGTKAGMMTYFTPEGAAVPATVIALEEGNIVTMVKTQDTDGYDAVQVGYKVVAEKKVKWPEMGHLKKAGCPPMKHLREFKVRAGSHGPTAAAAAATAASPALATRGEAPAVVGSALQCLK
jgi:ribosomal protein L3